MRRVGRLSVSWVMKIIKISSLGKQVGWDEKEEGQLFSGSLWIRSIIHTDEVRDIPILVLSILNHLTVDRYLQAKKPEKQKRDQISLSAKRERQGLNNRISKSFYSFVYSLLLCVMARSLKKWFRVHPKLLKKVAKMQQAGEKKVVKVWDRASTVIPDMIGFTFAVHNGKQFISVYVTEEMIGHRLGEFAPTRTFRGHPF